MEDKLDVSRKELLPQESKLRRGTWKPIILREIEILPDIKQGFVWFGMVGITALVETAPVFGELLFEAWVRSWIELTVESLMWAAGKFEIVIIIIDKVLHFLVWKIERRCRKKVHFIYFQLWATMLSEYYLNIFYCQIHIIFSKFVKYTSI